MPVVPVDSDTVLIVKGAYITIDSDFVLVALFASFTCAVKVEVPAEIGVPDMTPVELFNDNPAGKVPIVFDHRYGCRPPVAARV
jgi:hypothetical protein